MRPLRVCFLAQLPALFAPIESVWRACAADPRFDARILSIPAIYEWSANPSRIPADLVMGFLRERGIPFVNEGRAWLDAWAPDVIFVGSPFELQRTAEFQVEDLAEIALLAYVPYGFEIGGGGWQSQQFGAPLHNLAWRIFARSERVRRLYEQYGTRGADNVVVCGHPKLDVLSAALADSVRPPDAPRTVLWNPHFDIRPNGDGWSTFKRYWYSFPELFARCFPDMHLIIRPHPLMRQAGGGTGLYTEVDDTAWRRWVSRLPNVTIDDAVSSIETFVRADALVSDTSSFLFEFLLTKRPICYLQHPDGPGLNEEGSIVDSFYQAGTLEEIAEFLGQVQRGDDPMRDVRIAAEQEYLHSTDGRAGERIRDHIFESLAALVAADNTEELALTAR